MTEPERIGKYQIVGKIGSGAMGEVYKAHDPVLNRFVAIKTMAASMAGDPDLVQRFQREAQSAARLNHPNIVTVFDFGEEHGKFYLAMELLQGTDLKDVITNQGLNDLWDKLDVMEQICEGLAFAHAHGVVHRDLKPANIHILPNGRVKIMDFGLARLQTSEMTRAGMVMGTPNYMSPEQVRGERADARSDIFSLGAVFYELLSGRKAFQADSMHSILFKVLDEPPEPVVSWVPDLPAPMVGMLDRTLRKDPEERFQTATELREELQHIRDEMATGNAEATFSGGVAAPGDIADDPTMMTAGQAVAPVTGATALDPARLARTRPGATRVPAGRTVVAGGRTQLMSGSQPPPRTSRGPLLAAGAAVLLVVAGATALVVHRTRVVPPAPSTLNPADLAREQEGILKETLVANQIELARTSLQDKQYDDAITQAQVALKADPSSAEAKDIVGRARQALADVDSAAGEARTAFKQGDTARASSALSKVMALDPRHPVVAELGAALNQHFRGQAEDARRMAQDARTAAERLKASGLDGYAQASALSKQGDEAFAGEQYAAATQRWLEARDGYERARRAAEVAAAKAAHATTAPPVTMAHAGPGITAPPAVTAPPVTAAPVVTAPPVTASAAGATQEPAIRRLIADYGRAIESKDLALFKTVKPNLSGEEEKRLQDAFKAIKQQQVAITIDAIQVDGAQAVVKVSRQDTINGKAMKAIQQTFRLAQGPGGWAIQSIGQ